jgi:hypothetical protein
MLGWPMRWLQLLRRFLRASSERKFLLLSALLTVLRVRISLTFLGYKRARHSRPSTRTTRTGVRADQIARDVSRVSRFVIGATCLTQAVAAQRLLSMHGYESTIRIGVKSEGKRLKAHAWLLCQQRVILGGEAESLSGYSVLTDFPTIASQ